MAISLFGQTWVPAADNAATPDLSTTTQAITPPAGMQAGDMVLLFVAAGDSGDYDPIISEAGGQTWTAEAEATYAHPSTHIRLFHCVFDGTWDATPSVAFQGTAAANPLCMWMGVFRGVDTLLGPFDVAPAERNYGVTTAKTLGGITTNIDNSLVLHLWGEPDDNTINARSAGWAGPDGQTGALHEWVGAIIGAADLGIMLQAKTVATAGASGDDSVTLGTADVGAGYVLALRAAPVTAKAYYRQLFNQ